MINKFKLLKDDSMYLSGRTLRMVYRIKYLINIDRHKVKAGDLGGYLQYEDNLSHKGDCVVLNNAKVFDSAIVSDNASMHDNSSMYNN